jgi:Secretion system C-terminal sorting domain
MRKIYTLCLLLCLFSVPCFGQNWEAFTSGRTYHYRSDTAMALPDQSIHFDDVQILGADSVFSVARRFVFPVDTSQRNQPMFCGRDMRAFADGTFNFKNPGNFALPTRAALGTTFVLDSINGLSAAVTHVYARFVFGLSPDSIKVFTINSLDSLVLSKAHGILEWPASMGGSHFLLRGIQEDNFGEILPGFDGFFPYHPGDEYFFESEITSGDLILQQEVFRVRFKVDTNQRVIGGSNIHWSGFVRHESYFNGNIDSIIAGPDGGSFMLMDDPADIVNKSHHEQVRAPRSLTSYSLPSPWATYNITSAVDTVNAAWNGLWSTMTFQKSAGKTELHFGRSNGTVGWLYYGIGGDTCVRSSDDQIRATFREGMGVTHVEFGSFFMSGHFDLVGSIINGDTTGVIFADSVLMANAEPLRQTLQWNAFPNPAQDQLTITWTESKAGEISVLDLTGRVLRVQAARGLGTTVDVRDLPAGMYLVRFTQGGAQATKRVMVAH